MSPMLKSLTGQCLCGGIAYEVDALEPKMGHCHCTMCRKFHGAAFATYGEAKTANFRWLRGEDKLRAFVAENGTTRKFCCVCGSSMIFQSSGDCHSVVEFALGTLETAMEQRPDCHVYTKHKAQWYEIHDGLPQYENGRK